MDNASRVPLWPRRTGPPQINPRLANQLQTTCENLWSIPSQGGPDAGGARHRPRLSAALAGKAAHGRLTHARSDSVVPHTSARVREEGRDLCWSTRPNIELDHGWAVIPRQRLTDRTIAVRLAIRPDAMGDQARPVATHPKLGRPQPARTKQVPGRSHGRQPQQARRVRPVQRIGHLPGGAIRPPNG
jgi:hypothetical protein